ncbi:MAG: DUF3105 domain-containing protein, partial [Actinomycetota bacterium]
RRQMRRRRRIVGASLAGVVALVGIVAGLQRLARTRVNVAKEARAAGCSEIRELPDQGRKHLEAGEAPPTYNSNPPTSGPHAIDPAPWGSYDDPVPAEIAVHNLEHGGTVIRYNNKLSRTRVKDLTDLVESYEEPSGVMLFPDPGIDRPLALAAWRRLRTCREFSEPVVRAFIEKFCNKGPERQQILNCRPPAEGSGS